MSQATSTRSGRLVAPATVEIAAPLWDATGYLTAWLVLLFVIPANQVVGPLGAIGTPALILAGGALVLWLAGRAMPSAPSIGIQPLRIAVFVYVWYVLATVAFANTRPLAPLEQSSSSREVITVLFMAGISLAVMDNVPTLERLETLLRRLAWSSGFLALIGVVQSVFGSRLILRVPGLSINQFTGEIATRSIFNRPYGTALHPIEFGVMVGALLPLALYFALESEPRTRRRHMAVASVGIIALAVPLSISRSAILAVLGSMAVMMLGWSPRRRAQGLVLGLMALPVLWLTIPGLLGTFRGLFTSFDTDPSVVNRLDRVPRILALIREYPVFGRGAGTFSVESYFLVDNEFWVSTIEIGIVGICLLAAFLLLACVTATTSRHHPGATPSTAHMGFAIAAGIAGIAVSLWTFDAFFFHILRGTLFLLIGAAGALWRLTRQPVDG